MILLILMVALRKRYKSWKELKEKDPKKVIK